MTYHIRAVLYFITIFNLGSAIFSFEYIEDIEMVFPSLDFFFDLKEAMKLSFIENVSIRYIRVEGSIEVIDSMRPLHEDWLLVCYLRTDDEKTGTAAIPSMTRNFSSQSSIYAFSFEKNLRQDATLKVYEANGRRLKNSLKCTVKNLKTSICAGIVKR